MKSPAKFAVKSAAVIAAAAVLVILAACCSLYPPEYAGVWVDDDTLYGWTITLSFERSEFTIETKTYDALQQKDIVSATGGVMSAEAGLMRATITDQIVDGEELGDPELQAYLTFIGGGEYTAEYEVTGDTLELSGDLVEKLLSVPALTAKRDYAAEE